jgi:hypothetical protein
MRVPSDEKTTSLAEILQGFDEMREHAPRPLRHPLKKYSRRDLAVIFVYTLFVSLGLSICGVMQLSRVDGFCLIGIAALLMGMFGVGASTVDKTDAEDRAVKD